MQRSIIRRRLSLWQNITDKKFLSNKTGCEMRVIMDRSDKKSMFNPTVILDEVTDLLQI
jgi:predicted nucleic acid-binding protein